MRAWIGGGGEKKTVPAFLFCESQNEKRTVCVLACAAARDGEESAETDRVGTQRRERCVGML